MRVPVWLIVPLLFGLSPVGAALAACEDYVPQPKPQNVGRSDVGQTYDEIIERGWISFAVYENHPPYSWADGREPKGVDVELGRLIAAELGVEPRFNVVAAAENVAGDLRNNVWRGPLVSGAVSNVMLRVPFDVEFGCRNEQVVLTGPYQVEKIAVAWDRTVFDEGPPTPAYFRFDPVGVENDSLADFYLANLFGGQLQPNIHRFIDVSTAMEALVRGEVAAVLGPLAQVEYGARNQDNIAVDDVPLVGLGRGEWTLGVAVRHTYRQLGYAVDDAIRSAIADGRLEAIYADYELTFRPPEW
ncbi:MAG: substrate-binding periplasmic protein [Geminicoccaceae bacterium]